MVDRSVLVVGAGAIGGVVAGRMAGRVRRVAVLDASAACVERLRSGGLLLEDDEGAQAIPLDAYASAGELRERFDLALLAVKATALPAVLPALVEADVADAYVSLGNGLVQDRIAEAVGAERLVAGIVELGATNVGPGHVRQTTRNPFVIGELDGMTRERTLALQEALATVEPTRVSTNIRGQIWSKLLVNATFSGIGVVGGVVYGAIVASPVGRLAAAALWEEGVVVGEAAGVALEEVLGVAPHELTRAAARAGAADRAFAEIDRRAAATRASMLQDIERGARTEVDVINGSIVARAERLGLDAPANRRVVELVHAMERGELRPSVDLFEDVLAAGG